MIIGSFVGSFDYTLVTPIQKKIDCTDKPLLLVKMNEAYDSDFSTESAKLGQELMDGRIKANSKAKYKKSYIHFVNYARDHFPDIMHNNESVILEHIRSSHLKDFFGHISIKRDRNGNYAHDPPRFQSYSHVCGFHSGIKNEFIETGTDMDKDAEKTIKKILSGYKRKVARLKQQGAMKVTEGKAQITFAGYKTIAQKAVSAAYDFALNTFAWVFLLISWNIMARCSTSSAIMIDHLEWENDSLLLHVPSHKGDQDGETSKLQPRHVYANPLRPLTCPILALAVYILQYTFSRWLRGDKMRIVVYLAKKKP